MGKAVIISDAMAFQKFFQDGVMVQSDYVHIFVCSAYVSDHSQVLCSCRRPSEQTPHAIPNVFTGLTRDTDELFPIQFWCACELLLNGIDQRFDSRILVLAILLVVNLTNEIKDVFVVHVFRNAERLVKLLDIWNHQLDKRESVAAVIRLCEVTDELLMLHHSIQNAAVHRANARFSCLE